MTVLRSRGEPDLIYVLLSDAEAQALRDVLPKKHALKRRLKAVLRGSL